LKQVTPANVASLQAKWVYHMAGQETIQAVPIVSGGVMYISQFNRIDAIDARSGNIVWQYQRPPLTRNPQRGTAIYNNKLFVTAVDGALVAIDSRTGHTVWETAVAPPWRLAGQAPLVAKGKVIVSGNTPSGFIQAYDAESGKHLWTWSDSTESRRSRQRNVGRRVVQARRRSCLGQRQLRSRAESDLLWYGPARIAMGRRGARGR
jgi:alcohol dehydrogenase (cytochrome c)